MAKDTSFHLNCKRKDAISRNTNIILQETHKEKKQTLTDEGKAVFQSFLEKWSKIRNGKLKSKHLFLSSVKTWLPPLAVTKKNPSCVVSFVSIKGNYNYS